MTEKKMFATRIDPEVLKELKHLSVDTERPISDLMEEAIVDLLEKHKGKADK
jgi:predicted transcriptional regulator